MVRLGCRSGEGLQVPVMFARTYYGDGSMNRINNTQSQYYSHESIGHCFLYRTGTPHGPVSPCKYLSTLLLGRST
jgi:hypothetical protein